MDRNGKWTVEEEAYTTKLIELFLAGQLDSDIQEGDTLRAYLSKKLNCKPMRITKKYGHRQILSNLYQQDETHNKYNIEDRQLLDELRDRYITKDKKVQVIRKKRKKYLKGPSSQPKERKQDDGINSLGDDDIPLDDMFFFSWDDDELVIGNDTTADP
mmetsp:Transcript_33934/g.34570  ORF Transcript_33934/g.34570 Transcript_33934/m.34570 type:complete len:158 (-) Transcript_33934:283-756(-)